MSIVQINNGHTPLWMNETASTNSMILKWMDKYLNPYEWFLEISGGEPGLYKGINELISTLNSMGYYGIIRTNGTLPIYK